MDDKESSFIKDSIKSTNQLITVDGVVVATLSCIETAYKQVFEDRKIKKQQVKMLEAKATFDPTRLPKESKEDLNKTMGEISLLEAKARDYSKSLATYEKSLKDKEEAETRLNSLKVQLKEFENLVKPEESVKTTALSERSQFEGAIRQADSIIATNKANIELFEEVDDMCDALMEIVKPKVEAKVQAAREEERNIIKRELIDKKLAKGMSVEEIADLLEESVETIQKLMKTG